MTPNLTPNGAKIWVIEKDGDWTPGTLIRRSMFGMVVVQREYGDTRPMVWYKRNVFDHETGERMV